MALILNTFKFEFILQINSDAKLLPCKPKMQYDDINNDVNNDINNGINNGINNDTSNDTNNDINNDIDKGNSR